MKRYILGALSVMSQSPSLRKASTYGAQNAILVASPGIHMHFLIALAHARPVQTLVTLVILILGAQNVTRVAHFLLSISILRNLYGKTLSELAVTLAVIGNGHWKL